MVSDNFFFPLIPVLNAKTDLGEAIKSIFEVFLGWSRILKYFIFFLEIRIVSDFLLSLKFVS